MEFDPKEFREFQKSHPEFSQKAEKRDYTITHHAGAVGTSLTVNGSAWLTPLRSMHSACDIGT